jgi:hypothetical protein
MITSLNNKDTKIEKFLESKDEVEEFSFFMTAKEKP